ncbi:cytochrome P450 71A1-like [Chenopodium quinoa]|nr:cytochrome P450 71A1-like [Chenopodium quinoa]
MVVLDFLLVLGLTIIFLILLLLSKNRKTKVYNPPPGPKGFPIIGNFHQFGPPKTNFAEFYTLGKTYGPILKLRLMKQSMIVIQSAKLAKEAMQTNDKNTCDRPVTTGRKKVSYNLLDVAFGPYNEYVREMKKILSAHFSSSKNMQLFANIRREEVTRLMQKVSSLSSASKLINLNELIINYASANASRFSFGKRYNDEEVLGNKYHRLLHDAETMFTAFFYNDYFPIVGNLLDKLTGKSSRLEKIFKELDAFYEQIINDHLGDNKLNSEHEYVVDLLLRLKNDTSFPFKLTMEHIKAIFLNLFAAGANSSTATIIWVILELVKNPISMKKVQEELRNEAQKKGTTCIEEIDLPNLEYFRAVVKETLRLHPPAPLLIPREVVHKCVIGGYNILPKTKIFINAWAIGRDPECWEDPEKFIPERFVGSSGDVFKALECFAMIPFGRGRRMCPAYSLGVANLELALANLLYSFNWELPTGVNKQDVDNKTNPGITMLKKNTLYLVANKF